MPRLISLSLTPLSYSKRRHFQDQAYREYEGKSKIKWPSKIPKASFVEITEESGKRLACFRLIQTVGSGHADFIPAPHDVFTIEISKPSASPVSTRVKNDAVSCRQSYNKHRAKHVDIDVTDALS